MTEDQPDKLPDGVKRAGKDLGPTLATIIVVVIVLMDGFRAINGGGLSSIYFAIRDIQSNTAAIFIDDIAILTASAAVTCLIFILAGKFVAFDFWHERSIWALTFIIMLCAYALDAFLENRVVSFYMRNHGYERCEPLDREVGKRRGLVRLNAYVRDGVDCRAG